MVNDWQSQLPSQIRGIIADLKSIVDHLNSDFADARDIILELARRLDEGHLCERNQICRRIKAILKDQLRKGQITERWIEDCLPADYKRGYSKSEVTSVSKKAKNRQEIEVDNSGNTSAGLMPQNCLKTRDKSPRESLFQKQLVKNQRKYDEAERCPKCTEYEEALLKTTQVSTAEQLVEGEVKIKVPKDRYEEIISAMEQSDDFCYILFDSTNRTFVHAESDIDDLI
jgi:hypothetical protein